MKFSDYQTATAETAIYPDAGRGSMVALAYVALGLAGEAGEVSNVVKKMLRDDLPYAEVRERLGKELGDLCWYIARLCAELGIDLDDVASHNVDKLLDRKARGVLGGSGDTR